MSDSFKDYELSLFHYIIDTGRFKLMTGWQEQSEIDHIKEWQEISDINDTLSNNYASALKKIGLRGFTEISAFTSSNNPKEIKIKDETSSNLLELPENLQIKIKESVRRNFFKHNNEPKNKDNNLPF